MGRPKTFENFLTGKQFSPIRLIDSDLQFFNQTCVADLPDFVLILNPFRQSETVCRGQLGSFGFEFFNSHGGSLTHRCLSLNIAALSSTQSLRIGKSNKPSFSLDCGSGSMPHLQHDGCDF